VAQSCTPFRVSPQKEDKTLSDREEDNDTEVVCRFVQKRNTLLCYADFGPMFMDLYLHLGQNGVVLTGGVDEKLKLLLSALVLHAAARPLAETCAWTIHFESEALNLFAVAESPSGRVVGQIFAENVRSVGKNILYAETVSGGGLRTQSSIEFLGPDVLSAVAAFYKQSEQRLARFFSLGGDGLALLVAQPDADLAWLQGVGAAEVLSLTQDDSREPLETRKYFFACGCSPDRIARAIWPALRNDLAGIFGGDPFITVSCPRCGVRYEIARAVMDSLVED